jgi:hypothetical protein
MGVGRASCACVRACALACVCATWARTADWDLGGWYVYISAQPGASVFVNGVEVGGRGKPAGSRTLLTHNCRIVVGVSHYLRFHNAAGAAGGEEPKDWAFANDVGARPGVVLQRLNIVCMA